MRPWYREPMLVGLMLASVVLLALGVWMSIAGERECRAAGGELRCWIVTTIVNADGSIIPIYECECVQQPNKEKPSDAGSNVQAR